MGRLARAARCFNPIRLADSTSLVSVEDAAGYEELTERGVHTVSWDLDADTAGVATARRLTKEALSRWGCDGLIDDAQLVVTELVTNAILHSKSDCTVTIDLGAQKLRIAVTDNGNGVPEPQPFDLTREGGRGLLIVATLADAWGVIPEDGAAGKTVWAELVA
jgi:anti-sigma regulatory factor (Ser/Thr protein kinase)